MTRKKVWNSFWFDHKNRIYIAPQPTNQPLKFFHRVATEEFFFFWSKIDAFLSRFFEWHGQWKHSKRFSFFVFHLHGLADKRCSLLLPICLFRLLWYDFTSVVLFWISFSWDSSITLQFLLLAISFNQRAYLEIKAWSRYFYHQKLVNSLWFKMM